MTETDADRLQRLGVSSKDLEDLQAIWGTHTLSLMLDERALALCDWGYNALDTFDAIWHELEHPDAHRYMQHAFTPHQAFVLSASARARHNLWGPDFDTDRLHEVLDAALPRHIVAKILLVSETPTEADEFIATCTGEDPAPTYDGAEVAILTVEGLAAENGEHVDICNCK